MKIIIIGSKGFIGQYLFNHFLKKGNEVWGADVLDDYLNLKKYFIINSSDSDYNQVFRGLKYDLCINCSGAASVHESLTDPSGDYYLNTVNVYKILEAIKRFQPGCRFINLSSAAVYGNPQVLPVKEDLIPNPLSPYGFHKLQSELICKEFWTLFGIRTCSLRIFSVYGPGLRKQLFWDLFKKAEAGTTFLLFGTGQESRDFIYVLDLIEAIELAAEFSSFEADVINIANGEEIFIKDAVSIFFSFLSHDISYTFSGSSREGDPINWVADISKLISFGYIPRYDLRTGLSEYYEWINVNKIF
jgi:dTDP-glucose 4,6-dehydratase/UDP-glucose 4-epimerase